MQALPLTQRAAKAYIDEHHRHHKAAHADVFRIAAADDDGTILGVMQVGRPVNRNLDDGRTLEVLRLCSEGGQNVCSFLYSRAARIAKELGYKHIVTYILETENGSSLRASGWLLEAKDCGGGSWDTPARRREDIAGQLDIFGNEVKKYPQCKKHRYGRYL